MLYSLSNNLESYKANDFVCACYLPGYLSKQTVYQNEKQRLFSPDKFIG